MAWFILAISTAFFEAVRDLFNKTKLKTFDEYTVTFFLALLTVMFLLPWVLRSPPSNLASPFWPTLLADGSLNTVAYVALIRAIKLADLSIVAPLTALTPLFLLLTSPILVGEFPPALSLLGVLSIAIGSYVLNVNKGQQHWLAPFRAMLVEPGPRLAVIVAFLWSITSNLDKIGIQASRPIFWVMMVYGVVAIALFPAIALQYRGRWQQLPRIGMHLLPIGLTNAAAVACQMVALKLTLVVYVISIKRTSAVFSVLFGHLFLGEKHLRSRLAGSVLMVLGAIFIALA